jgi:ArsR family transcriptional regulator
MRLTKIYQCLCDTTRLRILNLLSVGPLCVCHFQGILGEPQVKISKHLAYLRARGLVRPKRCGKWMVYSLPTKKSAELDANLRCLQDCLTEYPIFKRDLARRTKEVSKTPAVACDCAA